MEQLRTTQETAEMLSVSIHTVRAWIRQKRVPYVKVGRRNMFRESDLDLIVKEGFP